MNISQVGSGIPVAKNYSVNPQAGVTPEQAADFETNLNAPSETHHENLSQDHSDPSVPQASWDVFWKGFNQSVFDHDRREFAYYEQKRREIDYGNKP